MKNYRLTESTIGHAKVIVDILPGGKVIPNTKITPTSITIHNTGVVDAPAKNSHNYMKNCNKHGERLASWHFTVCDKEIYQAVPTNMKAWHAGNATGNSTSIGIEISMFSDKERQRKAYENAIELVKILMKYHGFKVSQIKRHKDWSGKICPQWLIEGKYGYTWSWFKEQLETTTVTPKPTESFTVKIITSVLNIRKGAGTNHPVVGTVKAGQVFTIVETKDGFGKLLSGAGWISINSKYVKKL